MISRFPFPASLPRPTLHAVLLCPSPTQRATLMETEKKSYDYSLIVPSNPGVRDPEAENICGDGLSNRSPWHFHFMLEMEAERSVISTTTHAHARCRARMTAHRSMYPDSTCERTPTLLDLPRPRHSTCKRKQDAVRVGRFSSTAVHRGNSTASAPLSRCRQARQDSAAACSVLSSVYL